jgi:WD40 repeat protein
MPAGTAASGMVMMEQATPTNPYVGPRPYEREDSGRFFGRDQEASELLSLIVANRAVVLYAQSGAGKTSLLNASVIPALEAEGFEVFPVARVQGPALADVDLAQIPNIYVFYTLVSWSSGEECDAQALATETIAGFLAGRPHLLDEYGDPAPRALIIDQFEELFTTFPQRWRDRESFFNQLNQALQNDPVLRIVFSMREDYVAQLDPYADLLPKNLKTRFRLERMRPEAALRAVRDPLAGTGREFAPGVAEQLVEDLRQVRVESAAGETTTVTGEFVEPVQLQVVCQNLWRDLPADVTTITETHLQTFGNIDQALATFYERALRQVYQSSGQSEKKLRRWFTQTLITPAGTRGTVYRGPTQTGSVANAAVDILENTHLIRGEWRAGARWYELTHDRLIEPIQQSNRLWEERRARQIRWGIIGSLTIMTILLVPLLSLALLTPYSQARLEATARAAVAAEQAIALTRAQATAASEQSLAIATEQAIAAAAATQQAVAAATEQAIAIAAEQAVAVTAAAEQVVAAATEQAAAIATEQAIARATATAASAEAQATITALERFSQPVRPLRPGISIGADESGTVGTLGGFVRDGDGHLYLLSSAGVLGTREGDTILQPAPLDGGKSPTDAIAVVNVQGLPPLPGAGDVFGASLPASRLVGLARLESDALFQVTIPDIGPIRGVREPETGMRVMMIGRTSGVINVPVVATNVSGAVLVNEPGVGEKTVNVLNAFTLEYNPTPADEGALVVDEDGYALGIVVGKMEQRSVAASIVDVLDQFDVTLIYAGQQLHVLEGHKELVRSVAFSPDGQTLASGSEDRTVRLWGLSDIESEPETLLGHTGGVRSLAFSADSALLASGSADRTLRLWDMQNLMRRSTEVRGHINVVSSVAFIPDTPPYLASVSWDPTLRTWTLRDQMAEVRMIRSQQDQIWSLAASPDGKLIATGARNGSVFLWDAERIDDITSEANEIGSHEGNVHWLAFSPDGQLLASAGRDGTIKLWLLQDLEVDPLELSGHEGPVRSLAFSPDGHHLASGGSDGIRLWDANDWNAEPLFFQDDDMGEVYSVAFAPNGLLLASGNSDTTVRIWQVR